jgi:hypothetical protein
LFVKQQLKCVLILVSEIVKIQCPPLNRITLGQHESNDSESDDNNRMIQLTEDFCALFIYKWASNIWLQKAADPIIRDPIKRRALYCQTELKTKWNEYLFINLFMNITLKKWMYQKYIMKRIFSRGYEEIKSRIFLLYRPLWKEIA